MTFPSNSNVKFVRCQSYHGRRGPISNAFRYNLDCLLVPVHTAIKSGKTLLSHNRFNLFSFFDRDHGDERDITEFADFILKDQHFAEICKGDIWLLTQPRFLGYIFNPVSFWFFLGEDKTLRAVLAEVNNTVKGRHFYVCHHDDFAPIEHGDKIVTKKVFYVSPFQDIGGEYTFRFQFEDDRIGAWIDFKNGDEGIYATMTGRPQTLSNRRLIWSAMTRPFGALRVITLIHWQALKLKLKGARYRKAPVQQQERITR